MQSFSQLGVPTGGRELSMKSARTLSVSGMRAYRTTRYPASVSSLSRAASRPSLPRCVLSSSSTMASTWCARLQTTKSAIFLSKRFLVPFDFAVRRAPKLTCASTTVSGIACVRRLNIADSFFVSGCRFLGFSAEPVCFPLPSNAAAITKTTSRTASVVPDIELPSVVF